MQALADGIDKVLAPFRDVIVNLEEAFLKSENLSLLFVLNKIDEFRALLCFLLDFINTLKTHRFVPYSTSFTMLHHLLTNIFFSFDQQTSWLLFITAFVQTFLARK